MRNKTIDISKGIGILMVVYIHTIINFGSAVSGNTIFSFGTHFIMCFFMPMFFICSGFFQKKQPWNVFLRNRVVTLLIPLFSFYILGLFLAAVINLLPGIHTGTPFEYNEIFSVFQSKGFRNGALWFLVALINSLVFFQVIIRIKSVALQIIAVIILLIIGYIEQHVPFRYPFYLGTSCLTLFFVYLGYYSRQLGAIELLQRNYKVMFVFIVSFILTCLMKENYIYLKSNISVGPFLGGFATGIVGSVSLLCFSALLSHNRYLEYCGKTTMPILCIHSLFTQVVSKIALRYMDPSTWYAPLVAFVIVVALTHIAAEFLLRYTPALVGKKK